MAKKNIVRFWQGFSNQFNADHHSPSSTIRFCHEFKTSSFRLFCSGNDTNAKFPFILSTSSDVDWNFGFQMLLPTLTALNFVIVYSKPTSRGNSLKSIIILFNSTKNTWKLLFNYNYYYVDLLYGGIDITARLYCCATSTNEIIQSNISIFYTVSSYETTKCQNENRIHIWFLPEKHYQKNHNSNMEQNLHYFWVWRVIASNTRPCIHFTSKMSPE